MLVVILNDLRFSMLVLPFRMFNTEICGHFCDNVMHFISQKVIFKSCLQTENGHHSESLLNDLIMHCVNYATH